MKYLKSFAAFPLGVVLLIVFTSGGALVASPAFGYGGGAVIISTPTPTLTSIPGDATSDGHVDILDFNALMVGWGEEDSGIAADLNGDSKVDLLDFNMLMVYWQ